jgi:hypothetical protein
MGLIWAVGGAGVGGVIELLDNVLPGGLAMAGAVDMWPQTLAIPSFMGGLLFGVVLGVAGARRRFHELSLPLFAGWGALAGLLLSTYAVSRGAPGFFLGIATAWGAVAAGRLAGARAGGRAAGRARGRYRRRRARPHRRRSARAPGPRRLTGRHELEAPRRDRRRCRRVRVAVARRGRPASRGVP